ncbi:hypothetical protein DIURU_002531 [Diutina rugosa]|uniref:Uncharacterized protein n=1 Tax=Diutina rugosa TaxID=5481 RepID=A0A642UPU5_DIURU|nr:uncharacterized protein DIURU_002531 [Diutina rugosa]KAA8903244.1 hypothetical protein DIURU_002531 [Diutina rugosa]
MSMPQRFTESPVAELAVPVAPTPYSSIIDSPEFQKIMEKLDNDEDRRKLVEIMEDDELAMQKVKKAKLSSSVWLTIANLNASVLLPSALDQRNRHKLFVGLYEVRSFEKYNENPMHNVLEQISKGQRYDIDEAREMMFKMKADTVGKIKDVYHSLQGPTPGQLEYIDNALDNVVQAQVSNHYEGLQKYRETMMDKIMRYKLPPSILSEAFLLVHEFESAVDAEDEISIQALTTIMSQLSVN